GVVAAVAVERDVGGGRVGVRGLDARDVVLARAAGNVAPDLGPGRAAVAADLYVAVVRADPEDAGHDGRLGDGDDRAVRADAVVLREDAGPAAGGVRLRGAGAALGGEADAHDGERVALDLLRQVAAHRPGLAAVQRLEEAVGAGVHRARVVRREDDGRVPVPAERGAGVRRRHDVGRGRLEALAEATGGGAAADGRARP